MRCDVSRIEQGDVIPIVVVVGDEVRHAVPDIITGRGEIMDCLGDRFRGRGTYFVHAIGQCYVVSQV